MGDKKKPQQTNPPKWTGISSGVMLAMQTGRDGVRCAIEALDTRRAMGRFWDLIERYYTRHFVDLFLQPRAFLQLPSGINAVLAGRNDLPWSVRWRLKVFFFLVWLQKRVPVVPRIERASGGSLPPATAGAMK